MAIDDRIPNRHHLPVAIFLEGRDGVFHEGAREPINCGPEPSILDDLCLGNVIAKYFSKLRFGTSKIQPN